MKTKTVITIVVLVVCTILLIALVDSTPLSVLEEGIVSLLIMICLVIITFFGKKFISWTKKIPDDDVSMDHQVHK